MSAALKEQKALESPRMRVSVLHLHNGPGNIKVILLDQKSFAYPNCFREQQRATSGSPQMNGGRAYSKCKAKPASTKRGVNKSPSPTSNSRGTHRWSVTPHLHRLPLRLVPKQIDSFQPAEARLAAVKNTTQPQHKRAQNQTVSKGSL